MSLLFTDNFTNAGGSDVDIASWQSVEQTSGSIDWDYQSGTTNPSLSVAFTNDRLVLKSGFTGGLQYHLTRVINAVLNGVDDYEVSGSIKGNLATQHSGIAARLQSGSQSGYVVRLGTNSGLSELVRIDSGTETVLDSAGATGAFTEDATLKVEGDEITWWTSAVSFGSPRVVTDATYASGKPGAYHRSWVDVIGHPGESIYVENFAVVSLVPEVTVDAPLDKKYHGLPYVRLGADYTLDKKYHGLAYAAEPAAPVDAELTAGANTINVSAPEAELKRLISRGFPNVRAEFVSTSQGIEKHSFPDVVEQDPALIP